MQRSRAERCLRRADRGRLRIGEDDSRHRFVIGLARLAENIRRDDAALILADMGQRPDAVDVADRPQALARAQMRVDGNAAALGSMPTVSSPMPSTRGRRPVATSNRSPLNVGGRRRGPGSSRSPSRRAAIACTPSASSMPSRRKTSPSASPSGRGSRGEDVRATCDEHHLAAETANRLRHLDADRRRRRARAAGAERPSCRSPRGSSRCPRGRAGPGPAG